MSTIYVQPDYRSLTDAEQARFVSLEGTIKNGLRQYHEVGLALEMIRDQRLYRDEYGTFPAYCKRKWEFTESQANRLIGAANVAENLRGTRGTSSAKTTPNGRGSAGKKTPAKTPAAPLPKNERQARAIGQWKDPAVQRAAWARVLKATGGHPTTAAIERLYGTAFWEDMTPEQQILVIECDTADDSRQVESSKASDTVKKDGKRYRRWVREQKDYAGREGWGEVALALAVVTEKMQARLPEKEWKIAPREKSPKKAARR